MPASLSRRSLLATSGAMIGTSVAGLAWRGSRAQEIEIEPPAATPTISQLGRLPYGATIASTAATLGFDLARMHAFVRDEIAYEPYAGALRGANGTLWSMTGNSVDKALLLAALLDEALVTWRFAFGPLSTTAVTALEALLPADPEQLSARYGAAQISSLMETPADPFAASPLATPPVAERSVDVDALTATSLDLLDRATAMTDARLAQLQDALDAAGIDLPGTETLIPALEIDRHAWIQVADGPEWVNLPLTVPEANLPGTPGETADAVPEDLIHTVTIRLVAEEYVAGAIASRDTLAVPFASADLVNEPIALLVLPPQSVANIGFTLNELFTGQSAYVPCLLANDIGSFADQPLLFGAGGGVGGALDIADEADGPAEGETLALNLVVDIASPGEAPASVTRPLFDRIGFAARQQGPIDLTGIEPVTMVEDATGQAWIAGLTSAILLTVDAADIPYAYAAYDLERLDTFGELALAIPGMVGLRDGLRLGIEAPQGTISWRSRPQVTMVSATKAEVTDLASGLVIDFDLLHHAPSGRSLDPGAGSAHPLMLAGIVEQVAEQLTVEQAAATASGVEGIDFGATVGAIFAAATEEEIPIVTLTGAGAASALDLAPEAIARIETALNAGFTVIVPEQPVEIAGEPRSGWWIVDPATGQTRDQLDDGRGGARLLLKPPSGPWHSTVTEETYVIRLGTTASQYYRNLAFKIGCYVLFAETGLALGFALGNGGGAGSVIAAGLGTAAAGSAALGGC